MFLLGFLGGIAAFIGELTYKLAWLLAHLIGGTLLLGLALFCCYMIDRV
jgi:hypothetical protein